MPPVGFPAGGFLQEDAYIQDNASFTFLHRIEEVELNIEDGRWQSALTLAQTLPDICGGIAFPESVEFLWDSEIIALLHNEKLTGIQIRNVKTGEESTLACDGVFVSVGRKPSTELMKDQIEIDPAGYIIADESTRTNIPGVFAVGDVRTKALRQVVTAVADGATAVHYAEEYLAGGM